MVSESYGQPGGTSASGGAPSPEQWSSYYTQKAAQDSYGLIGEAGAQAKSVASGFTPRTAYRFYNTANGVHFYTLSEQERNWVQANLPHFSFEGQGFFAVPAATEELSPVYRFYNPRTGAHFYTINQNERDHVIATLSSVFNYEGIAWYGSTVAGPGWFPIYRFFNTATGTHFYTATPAERDNVINTLPSFNYEGIGYYVRLSGALDTTLTGADNNNNGVRDSVEQVLGRLIPDALARQANMAVAAAYERVLAEPLPTTREQALLEMGELVCAQQAAGANLHESHTNGMARVIFDTDQRIVRFQEFLRTLDGGYLGSELSECTEPRSGLLGLGSKGRDVVSGRSVRVVFVNGIQNSDEMASSSSRMLSQILEFDAGSDFNYDYFHNPNNGLLQDTAEIRVQAEKSVAAFRASGLTAIDVETNQQAYLEYLDRLGFEYYRMGLNFLSLNYTDYRVWSTTAQLAQRIIRILEFGGERRVILVPHSQGNFFVESALAHIVYRARRGIGITLTEEDLLYRVKVFGVAPVSATTWNNTYISHPFDVVVHTELAAAVSGTGHEQLPPNTAVAVPINSPFNPINYLYWLGADGSLHGFKETYLNDRIMRDEDRRSFRSFVRDQIRAHMELPSSPPVVAEVRLPHTGITADQCYEAGSDVLVSCSSAGAIALSGAGKQDGMRADVNPMSYSLVGSYPITDCVRDDVTGLMWEGKEASGFRAGENLYTSYNDGRTGDASAYVEAVNAMSLCGFNDWRLPTVYELQGIVNYGDVGSLASIENAWFPHTASYLYLAQRRNFVSRSWSVYFDAGKAVYNYTSPNTATHVRLVRGADVPSGRYSYSSHPYEGDGPNNVVTDETTGLAWRRCTEGQVWDGYTCLGSATRFYFDSALAHAKEIDGWRVPNVKELFTIVEESAEDLWINAAAFPGFPYEPSFRYLRSFGYWTSTPAIGDQNHDQGSVLVVQFGGSSTINVGRSQKGTDHRLRLVAAER